MRSSFHKEAQAKPICRLGLLGAPVMKTTSLAGLWRDKRRLLVFSVCGIAAVGIGAAGMYKSTQSRD